MRHKILSLAAAALMATLAGAYVGFGSHAETSGHAARAPAAAAAVPTVAPTAAPPGAALPDFSGIVANNGPAVVNVSATGNGKIGGDEASPFSQLDPNDPLFQFFRRFQIIPRGNVPVHSLGSGFIVSADGIILTNAHVVSDANEVTVKLTDKREFKAKVVGMDKLSDIAVLRINADKLPVVRIGDPTQTRVGAWVLAIGSPFGFENSATAGIVSATGRSLPDEGYVPFIQTDVAVNPGNSGGPLFNLNGEVIGVNSQIYSRSGGYQGVSFAVPIDVAMRVKQQLVQHGKVSHGRLGISIQEVSQALAESFGLKKSAGALIGAVEKNSPAAKAGLQPGDIILKVDGTAINSSSQLPPLVADLRPGTKVTLDVWRQGQERKISLTVGELVPEQTPVAATTETDKGRLGLVVRPLTAEERKRAEVPNGLVVEQATGAAARAGLQPDDIVLAFNGEPLKTVGQLRALVAKAGKHAALLVERGGAKIFVPIDLG